MALHIYSLTTRYTVPLFVYLEETRFARLDTFLKKNFFITRREYSQITGLLKGKALRELNLMVEKGILKTRGTGNRIVYLKADNQQNNL